MPGPQLPDNILFDIGLNLQAIFNISDLPAEITEHLCSEHPDFGRYRQLILLGHGGKTFWDSMKHSGLRSDNPVDDFTVREIRNYFANRFSKNHFAIIYPGSGLIGLQELGKLAGWHHPSPFKVGITKEWGSWYAYRAVILADTSFTPSLPVEGTSPCLDCASKICVTRCPAAALAGETLDLQKCIDYRKQPASKCRDKCISRIICPVAGEHRYSAEQIRYHYSWSMKTIERVY